MIEMVFIGVTLKDRARATDSLRVEYIVSVQDLHGSGCRIGMINGDHVDAIQSRREVLDMMHEVTLRANGAWSSEDGVHSEDPRVI